MPYPSVNGCSTCTSPLSEMQPALLTVLQRNALMVQLAERQSTKKIH